MVLLSLKFAFIKGYYRNGHIKNASIYTGKNSSCSKSQQAPAENFHLELSVKTNHFLWGAAIPSLLWDTLSDVPLCSVAGKLKCQTWCWIKTSLKLTDYMFTSFSFPWLWSSISILLIALIRSFSQAFFREKHSINKFKSTTWWWKCSRTT